VLYALARAGKPEPALTKELWKHRFDLQPFEQVSLLSAMLESGETGDRPQELWKNLRSSLHVEADEAYVEGDDWGCDCSWYLGESNVHTTAAFLELAVKVDPEDPIAPKMAKWLLAQRRNGTWQNTLENGYALAALVNYYRAVEPDAPDFTAEILLDGLKADSAQWKGRSLDVRHVAKTTAELAAQLKPGKAVPFEVRATGKGRLYYSARLRYAPELRSLTALDAGFTVERQYYVLKDGKPALKETTNFAAGDLVQVRVVVSTAQARHNVVVDDPLPAGLEAVDAQLSSSAQSDTVGTGSSTYGINHTELRDDRVLLFADTLEGGTFSYTYVARATTPGTFLVAPTQTEEMYRPEVFGRNATVTVKVAVPGAPAGS
jgi:alpha-2-macroglobulin